MSKHLVEINFDELKFNLYDLLNVTEDADERKIKKAYRKIIVKFHPDKNNIVDDEIYNHLTLANQILTNIDLRSKYDEWLKSYGNDSIIHTELKQNYKDTLNSIKSNFPSLPDEAKLSYQEKANKLNERHGFDSNLDSGSTMDKYNMKKKELENGVHIDYVNLKNKKEFNSKFNDFKKDEKNKDIVKTDGKIVEFNQQEVGNEYLSITNYSMLYSEDNIHGEQYSSLDSAFKLQPKMEYKEEDVDKKMKDYKNLSKDLSTLKLN